MSLPKSKLTKSLTKLLNSGTLYFFVTMAVVLSLLLMTKKLVISFLFYLARSKLLKPLVSAYLIELKKSFEILQSKNKQPPSSNKSSASSKPTNEQQPEPEKDSGTIHIMPEPKPETKPEVEIVKFETQYGKVEGTPAEIAELISMLASQATSAQSTAKIKVDPAQAVAQAVAPAPQAKEEDLLKVDESGELDIDAIKAEFASMDTEQYVEPVKTSAAKIPEPIKPAQGGFGA